MDCQRIMGPSEIMYAWIILRNVQLLTNHIAVLHEFNHKILPDHPPNPKETKNDRKDCSCSSSQTLERVYLPNRSGYADRAEMVPRSGV